MPPRKPTVLEREFPKWRKISVDEVECPRCKKIIKVSRGSLSGVRAHELKCGMRDKDAEASIMERFHNEGLKQCSLSPVTDLIINAGLPLATVDSKWFRSFVQALCPSFIMPSRRTIGRELKKRIEAHPADTASTLEDVPDVGITLDVWSRSSRSSFIAVVGHYYSEADAGLKRKLIDFIDFRGRHTGANIAASVRHALNECKCISKVRAFTTDSASTNFRAMHLLGEGLQGLNEGFAHLGCAGHKCGN
ncbi:hypothetical protein FOZ63_032603 [Perkinsus olseni]|uniref:Zinc finger BED domain-containing protein 4 n=1 Tax=Perkinsus olseni TaxID=32597 RepID=A0A7J6QRM0_PEROL|nr:hypothetical protein FOZ63_032603 [Perkinsus olseni]KAF4724902.1 hypothetical protein FOZ62_028291 [Perkinsus olseni]